MVLILTSDYLATGTARLSNLLSCDTLSRSKLAHNRCVHHNRKSPKLARAELKSGFIPIFCLIEQIIRGNVFWAILQSSGWCVLGQHRQTYKMSGHVLAENYYHMYF
jgi:hypothetical protein